MTLQTTYTNPFDEMFDRLLGQVSEPAATSRLIPIDVAEDGDFLIVQAILPGVSTKDVSVQIEGNVLTLRAERNPMVLSDGAKVYRQESQYGTFVRSLRIGDKLDTSSIQAESRDGVLVIKIARLPEEKPRTITVNVAPSLSESNN